MAESDEHLKKGIFKMIEVNGNMSGFFGNGTKSYVRCQTDYLLKVGMPIAINNIFNGMTKRKNKINELLQPIAIRRLYLLS